MGSNPTLAVRKIIKRKKEDEGKISVLETHSKLYMIKNLASTNLELETCERKKGRE